MTIAIKVPKLCIHVINSALEFRKRDLEADIFDAAARNGRYGLMSTNGQPQWTDAAIHTHIDDCRWLIMGIDETLSIVRTEVGPG
jgi:hypothetical protein